MAVKKSRLTTQQPCDILTQSILRDEKKGMVIDMQNLQSAANYMYMYYGRIHL